MTAYVYSDADISEAMRRGLRATDYHREVKLAQMIRQLLEERTKLQTCTVCGEAANVEAVRCPRCTMNAGHAVDRKRQCPRCHERMTKDDPAQYCAECCGALDALEGVGKR